MEFQIAQANDENKGVVEELQYKLGHVANYITDRKSSIFYATGGSNYSPRSTRLIRFNITADGWLDADTLNVRFKFTNNSTNPIKFLNALAANFIYRVRVIASNQICEDLQYYNRYYNMIYSLLPHEKKMNEAFMAFGSNDDFIGDSKNYNLLNEESLNNPPQLDGGKSKTVQFNLFTGLLSQKRYIPLHYLKTIILELEIVANVNDAICHIDGQNHDWTITEPVCMCDIVSLDGALENEFAQSLLDGESIPLAYDSFATQLQAMPQADAATISLSRSFTRLKAVFITFYNSIRKLKLVEGKTDDFEYSDVIDTSVPLNNINHFYHPNFIYAGNDLNKFDPKQIADGADPPAFTLTGTGNNIAHEGYYRYNDVNDRLSIQIAIGAKNVPEQPIENLCSAYYHLRKTLDIVQPSSFLGININDREYRSHKFICAFDLQKCQSADFSGINSKNSDLLTIKLKSLAHRKVVGSSAGTELAKSYPEYMYITMNYSAILLISDKGVSVLE